MTATDPRYTEKHIAGRYRRIFAYIDGEIKRVSLLPEPERSMELTVKNAVKRFAVEEAHTELEFAKQGFFRIREPDEYDQDF